MFYKKQKKNLKLIFTGHEKFNKKYIQKEIEKNGLKENIHIYDYINDKDEFTLNAALIINKVPEIGIISAPAKNRLFYTYGDGNSFEIINDKAQLLNTKINTSDKENIKAVSYSDKLKNEIKDIHDKFKVTSYTKMKSSLKFCVIAAGEFDLYVAEPRASEWDIAAGDAILSNSGGSITDMNGEKIYYGKKDFKNPSLVIKSARLLYNE